MILSKIFAAFMSLLAALFPSFVPPNTGANTPVSTDVVSTSTAGDPNAKTDGSSGGGSSFLCGLGSSSFCDNPQPRPGKTTPVKTTENTTPAKPTTTTKPNKPTFKPIETTSTTKKATSTTKKATSTTKKATSTTKKATSTTKKATSTTKKATSTTKKATSTTKKATSTTKKATSTTKKTKPTTTSPITTTKNMVTEPSEPSEPTTAVPVSTEPTEPTEPTTIETTTHAPDISPGSGGFDMPGMPGKTTSTPKSSPAPVTTPPTTTENPVINPGNGGFTPPTTANEPSPTTTTSSSTGGGFDMPTLTTRPNSRPEIKDVIDLETERGILYPEWNDYRLQNGKTPLRRSHNVEMAAQRWADKLAEMARNNGGNVPGGYLHEKSYAAAHPEWNAYPSKAENVFVTGSPLSVRNVLTSFINSPGHNLNLQYENGKSYISAGIGIGSYQNPQGQWTYFVVYKVY